MADPGHVAALARVAKLLAEACRRALERAQDALEQATAALRVKLAQALQRSGVEDRRAALARERRPPAGGRRRGSAPAAGTEAPAVGKAGVESSDMVRDESLRSCRNPRATAPAAATASRLFGVPEPDLNRAQKAPCVTDRRLAKVRSAARRCLQFTPMPGAISSLP
jgi:hypothetical protein